MTEIQKKLELRRERVAKTMRREIPDKVPILFATETYAPYYAGVKLPDITSYEQALEIEKKVAEELQFDCAYTPYLPQNLSSKPIGEVLGGSMLSIGENCVKQINPASINILTPPDYDGIIKDPFNYLLETVFPRRFKTLAGNDPEYKYQQMLEYYKISGAMGQYCADYERETGVAMLQDGAIFFNPVDFIFDLLRSFDIIKDIKSRPEAVRDAGLALVDGILKFISYRPPIEYKNYFCPMHLPTFLSPRDFEKVYWPSWKKLVDGMVAMGHNVIYEFEVDYSHLFDYLQELPPTHVGGIFEAKDMRPIKEKLGKTMTICGGLDTNILAYGTEQDCIDMVKRLIDDLAYDGGYFLCSNAPLCGGVDAKPENLKAAYDFANEYGVYK